MITELTKEQEAQLSIYRDMGRAIVNSTEPADFKIADQAIRDLYDFCELKQPEKIYHVDSPKSAQNLINELMGTAQDTYNTTHYYGYGQHESYWITNARYYKEQLGIVYEDKAQSGLDIMRRLSESSGFHYLYDTCAIICDRPEIISLNDNNEVHCEDGPAIKFRDGLTIYAIDGHVVTEKIIMNPETITTKDIQNEENAETSRIMIERYGLEQYLFDTEAKVLDMDTLLDANGKLLEGSAVRTLVLDKKGNKWLIGSDGSTKRTYNMSVPPDVNTCREAHEAIAGFDETRMIAEA